MSQLQVTGEAKIRDLQGPVVANSGVVTALDGAASQYVRGDGTLADFPTQTGGGSSVSYYLNGSVNQGTFGGSTYYQMSKNAITGTGTNFSTSADGLLAQFITDANDPDATSIPSGNWNIEFFMNVSASSGALASFYVEFYKYNGTTFTLVATNVATPEVLTGTTTIDAYYTSVAFPETALLQTDRLAIRIYANVASKTVTLYTEDNRLCQVVTTFSRGILSLNNLTDQQQYFAVGTSGSDFNIVSSLDTHTFNIPTASATKRGLLSTTDWSTFNNKVPYTGATGPVNLGIYGLSTSGISSTGESIFYASNLFQKSGLTEPAIAGYITEYFPISGNGVAYLDGDTSTSAILTFDTTGTRTFTLPNITGTFALLQGNQNFIGFKQFSDTNSTWLDYGISMAKGSTPSSLSSSRVNVYSNSGDKNLVIADTFASFAKLQFQATGDLTYTFPASSGTLALSSDLSAYVTLATTQTISGAKTFSATPVFDNGVSGMPLRFKTYGAIGLGVSGYTDIAAVGTTSLGFAFGVSASATKLAYFAFGDISDNIGRTYTFPNADGTIALTSNLSAYVTLATNQTISGQKTFTQNLLLDGNGSNAGTLLLKSNTALPTSIGYTSINSTTNSIYLTTFVSNPKTAALDLSGLSDNAVRTFTFPNTSGTIALTSNLSSYLPLTGGTLTGALSGTSATFSGNVGIGVTPSAWDTITNIQIKNASLGGFFGNTYLGANTYYNGAWKYITTDFANRIEMQSGKFEFYTAPSGTAGNAISFTQAMTLASTGNLLVGTTTDAGYKLDVNGTGRFSGALNGTSATFTSRVGGIEIGVSRDGSDSVGDGPWFRWTNAATTRQMLTQLNASNGLTTWAFNGSTWSSIYTLSSTGAATFSSSITIEGNNSTIRSGNELRFNRSDNGIYTRLYDGGSANGFVLDNRNGDGFNFQSAGTGQMRITSGGNVGIGTSSPSEKLHVSGGNIIVNESQAFGWGNRAYQIVAVSGASGFMKFDTNDTERMRITSGGNLLIGTTSSNEGKLQVSQSGSLWNTEILHSNSTQYFMVFRFGSTAIGSIIGNGTTTSYNVTSDYRLKQDFKDYSGLDLVSSIRTYDYEWKSDKSRMYGVVAHELQEVIPYAVQGKKDGEQMQGVDYSKLVPILIKSIQEQQAQIELLSNKIVALESK